MQKVAIAFIAAFFLAGTSWLFYSVSMPTAGAAELAAADTASDDDGEPPPDGGDPEDAGTPVETPRE